MLKSHRPAIVTVATVGFGKVTTGRFILAILAADQKIKRNRLGLVKRPLARSLVTVRPLASRITFTS